MKKYVIILLFLICVNLSCALDYSKNEIGADVINNMGITGKYQTICLIDDGVDYTHPSLGSCSLNEIQTGKCSAFIVAKDLVENDLDPMPEGSQTHGTQMAGIILSSNNRLSGIAPNAKIAIVRVFDYDSINERSVTSDNVLLDAIEWCINSSEVYNISAISYSIGMGYSISDNNKIRLENLLEDANDKKIAFVKSSGNRNNNDNYTMTIPAEYEHVISVGSNTKDSISYFTRRTGNLDLLASGDKIRSTIPGNKFSSFFANIVCYHNGDAIAGIPILRTIIPFCNYGTSYSAPHVTASYALYKEYDSATSPSDFERVLKETGDKIYDPITDTYFSKINLLKAFGIEDWPTYRHDNRRTGFTLLKGDMEQSKTRNEMNRVMGQTDNHIFARPSIGQIIGDDRPELVSAIADGTKAWLSVIEKKKNIFGKEKEPKEYTIQMSAYTSLPPSIGDVNGDGQNDIVISEDDTIAIYTIEDGNLIKKAYVESRNNYCDEVGYSFQGEFGGTAIADIDNNGKNNIIAADETFIGCEGFVYNGVEL